MSENFDKDNLSQLTGSQHDNNRSQLPEFVLYYQLYDVTRKKMLFESHNLKYTELDSKRLKNEATRNILKIISKSTVKNKEFIIASKQNLYKWMYTCNKQNLLQMMLYVGEEEPKLAKKYLQQTAKQYEEYNIGTTSQDIERRFIRSNLKINEVRGNSGERDINYALNKMKNIIVDAESFREEVNQLDDKTKQVRDKAQNIEQNATEIRQLSEEMDQKMKILIIVVCIIVAIIICTFLFIKLRKNIIETHQNQDDALKDLQKNKNGDQQEKLLKLERRLNQKHNSKSRLLVQKNYNEAYRILQNQQILQQYYTRRSIFHQQIIISQFIKFYFIQYW